MDAVAWGVAFLLATLLRYEIIVKHIDWAAIGWMIIAAIFLQLLYGWLFMLYRGRYLRGSFDSMRVLFSVTALVGITTWILALVAPVFAGVPRSVPLMATALAMLLMAGFRYVDRALSRRQSLPDPTGDPVIIYGAGHVGDHLARQMNTDAVGRLRAVAFLDDDPRKKNLRLQGVPVVGHLTDLKEAAAATNAKTIVVAMGDPDAALLEKVHEAAAPLGVNVQVMPSMADMLSEGVSTRGLRDLNIEDLLGRPQVDTDVSQIAGYLNGKTVLVTGAGGSIGQQLCVEIDKHGPGSLIMLDRDETGLQQTQISLRGNGLLDNDEVVLADIRDQETLTSLFKERHPDVVFHAAALKHLPMLERYPNEAWQTNVLGTLNVINACDAAGVQTLINISTDKAANPTSVLGISKRVAERLVAWEGPVEDAADASGGAGAGSAAGASRPERRFLSVRFGNVIGSRGSMLPTFQRLIEEGKPVTVTHPDATRYFMTIPEACQLVLQAGAIGRVAEVLILDMGEPVRILDVANKMIAISGKNLDVRFTGLRDGEKLHEDLHSDYEVELAPLHPKISHAPVDGLSPTQLDKSTWDTMVDLSMEQRPLAARHFAETGELGVEVEK